MEENSMFKMNKIPIAIVISVITLSFTLISFPANDTFLNAGSAYAACPKGAVKGCSINGQRGTMRCEGLKWSECEPSGPKEVPRVTTTLKPNYMVVTVVYSPPGNTSNAPSSVSYANGSSAGSTVGASSSFESGVSVEAESITETIGGKFGFKRNSESSREIDISKSSSYTIEHSGPNSTDGLNNDLDAIYLALRPTVMLSAPDPKRQTGNQSALPIRYSLKMDGAVLQYVHAGWLRNPATMPESVKATLSGAGITAADYPAILKASIYHEGGPVSATNPRLIPVNDNVAIPYQPPFAPGEAPSRQTLQMETTTKKTNTTAISRSYEVEVSLGTTVPGIFKLKKKSSFAWTNTRSNSTSQSATEGATLTITGPSFGYTGPTAYRVYLDSLYKTFVFIPAPPGSFIASGRLVRGNTSLRQQEVIAVVDGERYKTWTNSRGEYFIYAPKASSIEIRAAGKSQRFTSIPATRKLGDLNLQ
jgi:hypothetical protein